MRKFRVIARRWEHGIELHIEGVGVTQSHGVEDAEHMVRDYIETVDLVVSEPFSIEIEFEDKT